ncbi:sugar ABC transporter permease [Rhizobium sp. Root1203]|nr:sugar ABC transporter permease [Rhizobium sp. Root1203]
MPVSLRPSPRPYGWGSWRNLRNSSHSGLFVLLSAMLVTFLLLIGPRFLAVDNVTSMAVQLPELGVLSLAMMVSMLHGGVNLSIISTANISAITVAYVLTNIAPAAGAGLGWQIIAIAAGLSVAVLIGVLNGIVIAYFKVSPILATLGTMIMVKGLAVGLTRGTVISGFPDSVQFIGSGFVFGVPFGIIVFAGCCAVVSVLLNRTAFGATIYLMGSNEEATRFSGVDTRLVLVKIYVTSSVLAAIAGIIMMARFNSANASYGEAYLLATILVTVLGGVDPYGGFGKVGGVVLSLIVLQVVSSAFNQLGFSQFLTLAIWGVILIVISAMSMLRGPTGGR